MARTLKIQLIKPDLDLIPEFRNFGEDVYRALQEECEVSIGEIDASISEFFLRGIHKREVRTLAAKVRKIAEKSGMAQTISVSEVTGDENGYKSFQARPRFVLFLMFMALAFFLILMIAPETWHRKATDRAIVAWIQNPTPENKQAVEIEKGKARRNQYILCSLAILNVLGIIGYGALFQRRRIE